MRYQLCREFEDLYDEYRSATSPEARQIRLKLQEISLCYGECAPLERRFADDIIKNFCELLEIMKENSALASVAFDANSPANHQYLALTQNPNQEEGGEYDDAQELLDEFYEYFLKHHKESTVKDYAARIKTFASRYLQTVPRVSEMYREACRIRPCNPVLFTYRQRAVTRRIFAHHR